MNRIRAQLDVVCTGMIPGTLDPVMATSPARKKSTVLTTNKPFSEWLEVFPNAACVVSLVNRLTHNAEVIALEGESYRLKEARERAEQRALRRRRKRDVTPT